MAPRSNDGRAQQGKKSGRARKARRAASMPEPNRNEKRQTRRQPTSR